MPPPSARGKRPAGPFRSSRVSTVTPAAAQEPNGEDEVSTSPIRDVENTRPRREKRKRLMPNNEDVDEQHEENRRAGGRRGRNRGAGNERRGVENDENQERRAGDDENQERRGGEDEHDENGRDEDERRENRRRGETEANGEINAEVINIWDKFLERADRVSHKSEEITTKWTKKIKDYKNKKENPLRALVMSSLKAFCGKSIERFFETDIVSDEDEEELRRSLNVGATLSRNLNLNRQLVFLTKYLLRIKSHAQLVTIVTVCNLHASWERRNESIWKAFHIDDWGDDIPLELPAAGRIRKIKRALKQVFNRENRDGATSRNHCCRSLAEDSLVFACIVTETSKLRGRNGSKTLSVAYVAADVTVPFFFVQGDFDKCLDDLVSCFGGNSYEDLHLRDVGLDSVLSTCKQPKIDDIILSKGPEIRQRIQEETQQQRDRRSSGLIPMHEHLEMIGSSVRMEPPPAKREFLADVLKEPGGKGIRNLKLQFIQPESDCAFVLKFSARKGGAALPEQLSDLLRRGALKDHKPFFLAKDAKTNNLKLELTQEDGVQTWKKVD